MTKSHYYRYIGYLFAHKPRALKLALNADHTLIAYNVQHRPLETLRYNAVLYWSVERQEPYCYRHADNSNEDAWNAVYNYEAIGVFEERIGWAASAEMGLEYLLEE